MGKYKSTLLSSIPNSEQRYAGVVASRGCYHNCGMCSNKVLWNCRQTSRSAENVVDEIEILQKQFGINLIWLNDPNPSRKNLEGLANELLRRNTQIKWRSFLNAEEADVSLYKLMHASGYELAIFGIESGSNKRLTAINKGHTRETNFKAVTLAKKAGFFVHGTYMVGYPDETKEEFLESFAFLKTIGLDSVNFYFITPLPGTKFHEECQQKGLITSNDSEQYDLVHPVIKTRLRLEMGESQYVGLLRWCQKNFYDKRWTLDPLHTSKPHKEFLGLMNEKLFKAKVEEI
jgi:anaerobic magnesium-protoporphyrin IX monomethyl ester cyclase